MLAIFQLVVVLIVFGLIWWLVERYLPIPQPIKTIITVLLVLVACLFLLSWIGLLPGYPLKAG